jgi:lipid A disaccharide synthetase
MKKWGMTAALIGGLLAATPGWGADARSPCYTQSAIEAEQAIRYITDVMVASSACQNTTYAEFRLRNRDAIVAYQNALISHFHGAPAFDKWNTALANIAAQKQATANLGVFCQQADALMKHAKALDPSAFRAYAAAQAAAAGAQYAKCGGTGK